MIQQYPTAQLLPANIRAGLSGQLVCYARYVIEQEWPRMEDGEGGDAINPWGVAMFRTLERAEPVAASEQSAYDKWLDRTAEREAGPPGPPPRGGGGHPRPLWVVLFLAAALLFVFMLFFADTGERALVQGVQIGSVVAVISASLALVAFLDRPFQPHVAGLQPTAMERTLVQLEGERAAIGDDKPTAVRRARRGQAAVTAGRKELLVEIAATALLALSAVATAWSGYQSSQWHGEQALASGRATATRVESARASGVANRQVQIDVATFTAGPTPTPGARTSWPPSTGSGSATSSGRLRALGASRPLTNPEAAPTPFALPEYQLQALEDADRLEARGRGRGRGGEGRRRAANRYVLAVVLFATALALAGIGARLRVFPVRVTVIAMGWAGFLGALAWLVTFPISL